MFGLFKEKARERLKASAFPEAWRHILTLEMPLYRRLPSVDQHELQGHVQVLMSEKRFVGANGLTVTDEMRVLICGQAAMLLLHRQAHYFPNVDTIVIYKDAFVSNIKEDAGGGALLETPEARVGESNSKTGIVVLAWDSVRSGAAESGDGKNVVLHEFAHQLDSEKGCVDGAPVLPSKSAYRTWCSVMSNEFAHLNDELAHHHKTFIDDYGATSPAEFFAVVTEEFFEKPSGLRRRHPRLYELLAGFYQQDPAELMGQPASMAGDPR